MDIIDKLGKTATNTYKITVNKTNNIAQRTKLRMHINECKSKIEAMYNVIGKKIYEKHVREGNIDIQGDIKKECEQIDKISQDIEKSIEYLLYLKDMKKCPRCYSEIMIYYNFCPVCGKKQNNYETKENSLEKQDIELKNDKEAKIESKEKLEN